MMGPSNPYGPTGPPPPGLATQHPLNMPPNMGMVPNPMYSSSGPNPMPQQHGPLPPQGGMPPKHPTPRNMTNVQLQQLSAQMKAYRLLSRNVNPPEALMSIVHGRKLNPAMLAALSNKTSSFQGGWGGTTHSGGSGQSAPSPNVSPGPGSTNSGGGGGSGGGNINLYPPSPNLSQSQGASPKTPQPPSSSSSLTRSASATSLNVNSAAPNVTISSSGELPLPVRQAMSAAQTGSSSPVTTQNQPVAVTAVKMTVSSSPSTVSVNQTGKTLVKQVKLGPPGKPQGIDPMIIIKEREHR